MADLNTIEAEPSELKVTWHVLVSTMEWGVGSFSLAEATLYGYGSEGGTTTVISRTRLLTSQFCCWMDLTRPLR